jgi:tetratricopeptide (TPR) repeat protein|tara:strand:+ start:14 stop:781 length:768 start_codon:yes stop_codon:yes gene_type:complete
MATYKKRGAKKSISPSKENEAAQESTTAEVFETLDTTANKTEEWVVKYQNFILGIIGVVAIGVLGYLGYKNFVVEPKAQEAVSELNQAQYYFELAVNSIESDSLYRRALNGGEGKYGFLDIIENYKGTPAAKLATYSAGMAYLNLKEYENAITYLDQFKADDILLSALAKGAIGDAFAQLGQIDDAYDYYIQASKVSENMYSTPKYLYKAAMLGAENGKIKQAISFLERIEKEFPKAEEAKWVAVQKGKLEHMNP